MPALTTPNTPSITFTDSTLQLDTYTVTLTFSWTDPNFAPTGGSSAATFVNFTTTTSGG